MNEILSVMLIFTILDVAAGTALVVLLAALRNGSQSKLVTFLAIAFAGLVAREIVGYAVAEHNHEFLNNLNFLSVFSYSIGRVMQSAALWLLVGYLFFRKKVGKIIHVKEVNKEEIQLQ